MKRSPTMPSQTSSSSSETLTIRLATSSDAVALSRLAQLDSAPAREAVPTLVAEVGGDLRAALPLDGGRAIADPFERTTGHIAMLVERARQLEAADSRRGGRRWRPLRALARRRFPAHRLGRGPVHCD